MLIILDTHVCRLCWLDYSACRTSPKISQALGPGGNVTRSPDRNVADVTASPVSGLYAVNCIASRA